MTEITRFHSLDHHLTSLEFTKSPREHLLNMGYLVGTSWEHDGVMRGYVVNTSRFLD